MERLRKKTHFLPSMDYQTRLREYEKDKQRLIPQCNTTAEVEDLLRELREKWEI